MHKRSCWNSGYVAYIMMKNRIHTQFCFALFFLFYHQFLGKYHVEMSNPYPPSRFRISSVEAMTRSISPNFWMIALGPLTSNADHTSLGYFNSYRYKHHKGNSSKLISWAYEINAEEGIFFFIIVSPYKEYLTNVKYATVRSWPII